MVLLPRQKPLATERTEMLIRSVLVGLLGLALFWVKLIYTDSKD